jgi:ATP-dependent Clp protease protease subunit
MNKKTYSDSVVTMSKHRSIFLYEVVNKEMAATLSALLIYYDTKSKDPIKLYINSRGGDLASMFQIYDTMQMIQSPVSTICIGKAYSAGAVLLASGTKGMRHCMKNANVMVHGVQLVFPGQDVDSEHSEKYLEFVNNLNDNMLNILATHTGHPKSKIDEDSKRDLFLTAEESVKYGLVDSVI